MSARLSAEEAVRCIDAFLEEPPVEVGGLDLRPFLIVERYLTLAGSRPDPRATRTRLRLALRRAALRSLPAAVTGAGVREERGPGRDRAGRHLLVFGFPWVDQRLNGFNRGVLRALGDPADVVVVSNDPACCVACHEEGIDARFLDVPSRRYDRTLRFRGAWPGEVERLTQAATLLQRADALLRNLQPASVLTTQDFHVYDQAFARGAKRLGIPTLTHQHGLIPDRPVALFKYVFSDWIAVWGQRSARLMERWVSPDRIRVAGTDCFDPMRSDRPAAERPYLLLCVNPIGEERDLANLGAVSRALREAPEGPVRGLKPVLKLHPSLDIERWEGHAARLGEGLPWAVRRAGNEALLPLTRFLLAQRSTITLDAAVAGASVLELDPDPALGGVPGLFDPLPESVVMPGAAIREVGRRLANPAVEASLLDRQAAALAVEIEPGSASRRIAGWLRALERGGA